VYHQILQIPLEPNGKVGFILFQLRNAWPPAFIGSAQQLEDAKELVTLAVSLEQNTPRDHLAEYTADTPYIDSARVLTTA
jgi:hypothetical protein